MTASGSQCAPRSFSKHFHFSASLRPLRFRSAALRVNCSLPDDQRYVARGTSCDIGAFEFTDFTVVTLTIDANSFAGGANGAATVTGTVRCSRTGDQFGVVVALEQQQKVGKATIVVRGSGSLGVNCTTSVQPWSAVVTPASGAFILGAASATANTNNVTIVVSR